MCAKIVSTGLYFILSNMATSIVQNTGHFLQFTLGAWGSIFLSSVQMVDQLILDNR